jgi:hypothetical protein
MRSAQISNAPSPSPSPNPDPPPAPTPSRESSAPENDGLTLSEIEQRGFPKYGALVGKSIGQVGSLCPIKEHEWAAASKTKGTSWGYFVKVVQSMREEEPANRRRRQTKPRDGSQDGPRVGHHFVPATEEIKL